MQRCLTQRLAFVLRPLAVVQCQPNWSNELHSLVCFGGGGLEYNWQYCIVDSFLYFISVTDASKQGHRLQHRISKEKGDLANLINFLPVDVMLNLMMYWPTSFPLDLMMKMKVSPYIWINNCISNGLHCPQKKSVRWIWDDR